MNSISHTKISSSKYNSFRKHIPLFREIPDAVYYRLDMSGFYLPTGEIAFVREELEHTLQNYVVSYKAGVCNFHVPVYAHLCALVKEASLTKKQKSVLDRYEEKTKKHHVTFVVYAKPVTFIEPKKSAMYSLYKRKGLV